MTTIEKFNELNTHRSAFLDAIRSKILNTELNENLDLHQIEFNYVGLDFIIISELNAYQNKMIMKTYQIKDKEMIFGDRIFEHIKKLDIDVQYYTGLEDYYAAVIPGFKPLQNKITDKVRFATEYEKNLDSFLKEIYSK